MKPRFANPLAHELAMVRAQKLHPKLQAELCEGIEKDFADFKRGIDARKYWNSLAFASSVAEMLAHMGICSDIESKRVIRCGHDALACVRARFDAGGSWTMHAEELLAVEAALERHRIQLRFCSCGEYERARHAVRRNNTNAKQRGLKPGDRVTLRRAA